MPLNSVNWLCKYYVGSGVEPGVGSEHFFLLFVTNWELQRKNVKTFGLFAQPRVRLFVATINVIISRKIKYAKNK